MEMVAKIAEKALGMVSEVGEVQVIVGILMLISLLGIILVFFVYSAQKWASKCSEEQEKLNLRFDDQMFLLGKYYTDLIRLKDILFELRETLQGEGNSESPADSISEPADATAEVSAAASDLAGENSVSTPWREEEKESDRNYKQQISEGKRLIEKRLRELAKESNIEIREVNWYKKPGMISTYPYVLTIATDHDSEQLAFSEKEIAGFPNGSKVTENKLQVLIRTA